MAVNYYTETSQDGISAVEQELYDLIMAYRASLGLPGVPLSESLSIVAARHALDTVENVGAYAGHSWSDAPYDANNPATYPNMWKAPQRVGTDYPTNGFEITFGFSGADVQNHNIDAGDALEGWKGSKGHNDVITNAGPWGQAWNAIGVGVYKGIAHVWFGNSADPAGAPGGDDGNGQTGGPGLDIYEIGWASTETDIEHSGETITLRRGAEEIVLKAFERVDFTDGTVALDIDGSAGQAYRVYQAAFDREPDLAGLAYWIGRMDEGISPFQLAQGFVFSAEFISIYGSDPSNEDFVERIYRNVLDRDGEPAGIEFWVSELDQGLQDRSSVLARFSEGDENKARVLPTIDDGIFYT